MLRSTAILSALVITAFPVVVLAESSPLSRVGFESSSINPSLVALVPDLQGWRNTRWGMSVEEVKALYPFEDGMEIELGDPRQVGKTHIEIKGHRYKIRFVFLKSFGLESVNLAWNSTTSNEVNPATAIAEELQSKYGVPSEVSSKDNHYYTEAKWILPSTTIRFYGSEKVTLVGYRRRVANQEQGF